MTASLDLPGWLGDVAALLEHVHALPRTSEVRCGRTDHFAFAAARSENASQRGEGEAFEVGHARLNVADDIVADATCSTRRSIACVDSPIKSSPNLAESLRRLIGEIHVASRRYTDVVNRRPGLAVIHGISSKALQPFRDDREAERLRIAAQAEDARARAELENATKPLRPAPNRQAVMRVVGTIAMLALGIAVPGEGDSCHHVTPAEGAAMTKLVTRRAVASESHGPVPFDTKAACKLTVKGNFGVFDNCDVSLVCSGDTVFRNQRGEDCHRNDASTPTTFAHGGFSFDLDTRLARLNGATPDGPYVVLFTLE